MSGKDGKKSEKYDLVGGDVLSPTLTVEEKTDEEVYKEAFDHFDGNHSKTIPTSVSWNITTWPVYQRFMNLFPEPYLWASESWVKSNRGRDSWYDKPGVTISLSGLHAIISSCPARKIKDMFFQL